MNAHATRTRGSATDPDTPARACTMPWLLVSAFALTCALQLAACSGDASDALGEPSLPQQAQGVARAMSVLPNGMWGADGHATDQPGTDRSTGIAAQRSGPRHVSREQLVTEELVAGPYTLVIDADDEAAVDSGLQLAEAVHTFAGGKTLLGVFVRSRHPALAARLAERLTFEQGWAHVFIVQ